MNDRNLLRGLFLIAIALAFGIGSFAYKIGQFSRPGPGLFPLLVSVLLLLIGVLTVVRSRFVAPMRLDAKARNIGLVIASLVGFVLLSTHVNMIAGIVFMVFCATRAGTSYSIARNLKISAALVVVALLLQQLLGLNLPLY